jgi:APA family basic amino acid/polyamine antiporter
VIVLRRLYPDVPRPFRVPAYPWVPLAFVASSAFVLYSSLTYVRTGAVVGVGVMVVGVALLAALRLGAKLER